MTKYGIDPKVICQIIDLANRHHIKTVILFGSRARGDFRRTSDIDLAVQGGNICRLNKANDKKQSAQPPFSRLRARFCYID